MEPVVTPDVDLAHSLEACSSLNRRAIGMGVPDIMRCRSVTFNSRLRENLVLFEGNCWLKNGTPSNLDAVAQTTDTWYVSAALASIGP